MEHLEDTFNGADGIKLYYQVWRPEETPKAVVQIMHGFGEHSGRYLNVVNELVLRGYVVYANDHRGHGKSEGIQLYVKRFQDFIEDEKILFNLINEKEPDLPHFILGHSMGSTIAELYAVTYPDKIQGLVLSGVAIQMGAVSGVMKALLKFFGLLAPKMRITMDLAPQLSHDPEVVKAYREDPLVFKRPTLKLGIEFTNNLTKARKLLGQIKIPILVQSGSEDKAMLGAEKFNDLLTVEDKTVKIYPGLFHEVYNELEDDRKTVLGNLGDWLDSHC
jgi:alpha-beta hydrolase superfamily lysophospholipase